MIIFAKCVDIIVRTEYKECRITKHDVFLEERRCDGTLSFLWSVTMLSSRSVRNIGAVKKVLN